MPTFKHPVHLHKGDIVNKGININALRNDFLGDDANAIKHALANRLVYAVGKDTYTATPRDWLHTLAYMVRDRLMDRWMETMRSYYDSNSKRVYYLSLEFLMGRTLTNSLLNLGIYDECHKALASMGMDLEEIAEIEFDAALGNGGLGRLAACFLDSLATMGLPGYGYGIRYEYGMFTQKIENGVQVEHPDNWLRYGNPWEFPRAEVLYPVKFHGYVVNYKNEFGRVHHQWVDTDDVMAMAYDTPIPGYDTPTVNNMRLWAAKASRDFNLSYFNEGDYIRAVEDKNESENLSKVLYPDDTTDSGRELRLKQQYFFTCASLQDILYRFHKSELPLTELPNKVAIQLNDTHPSIAIAELMRILVDQYHQEWDSAWDITRNTFAYTNHTLLPEALETWPVVLLENVLPRHMQIIYEINHRFLRDVMHWRPGNSDLLSRLSIIDENNGKRVRMAHLAIVGSHKVNGVAALHSKLMQETIFADFHAFYPNKFTNITNGVTPRRWLHQANPKLSELIRSHIGCDWTKHLDELRQLETLTDNPQFRNEFHAIKQANKERLSALIRHHLGIEVNTKSMFDVQIKRIHEYKRQLLNVLHIITLYNRIRRNPEGDFVPRTVIFGGKAAPGYYMAKLVIQLINDVGDIVNNDPLMNNHLKVVFIPNYDVSTAGDIIPAADLSEQISTAGTEASGTGNMKLALNGALTIGTLDGANIEILEEVGEDNIFIFGMTTQEVADLHASGYNPWHYYDSQPELKQVLDMIACGYFSPDEANRYENLFNRHTHGGDPYMLLADYAAYIECQDRVSERYRDQELWLRSCILNVARMGKFSSDRTIDEYARNIWHIEPVD